MRQKDELRSLLLNELKRMDRVQSIFVSFDDLSLFDSTKKLDLESFYQKLEKTIPWSELRKMEYSLHDVSIARTISKVTDILSWIFLAWGKAVLEANLEKVVILFFISERLYLKPEEDLDWNLDVNKLKVHLIDTLGKVKLEIGEPTHINSSFADRKFISDYNEAVRKNDLKGIFEFFRALDFGSGMCDERIQYVKTLARIATCIDVSILPHEVAKFSPILMKTIIEAIDIKKLPEFSDNYTAESPLPLLICLRRGFSSRNGPPAIISDINWDTIFEESKLIQAIAQRVSANNGVSYVLDCFNLSLNMQTNATFATFVAGNPCCIDDYARKIDFKYDDSGEVSYTSLIKFATQESLDKLSHFIYIAFFEHLERLEYKYHLFIHTSYYHYLLQAIVTMSEGSYLKYMEGLEQVSLELLRSIYSWHPNQISTFATKWIYWILCSKLFVRDSNSNKSGLLYTYKLLDDKRFMNRLECIRGEVVVNFSWLKSFIEDSIDVNKITLPLFDKTVDLSWIKTE